MKILNKLKEDLKQGKTLILFTSVQAAGAILRMIAPLVIAGIFTKEMWDRYSMCETVVLFFSALFILSSRTPFIVYANEERGQTGLINKTFSVQCIFLAASIAIFLGIILIFGKSIAAHVDIVTTELFYVSLAFFALIIKDFTGNYFMAMNQRIRNSIVEISFAVFVLSFIFLFNHFGWLDLKSVFLSYFMASCLVLLGSLAVIDFKVVMPLVFDWRHFIKMLSFTFWGMAGSVSSYVINLAGVWLLAYYTSTDESGTYNFGFKFFKGFTILTYIASGYFLPHLSEYSNNTEKIKAYLTHKRPRILLLGAGFLALAWVLAPLVINLLYPGKYNDAGLVIRILIIGNLAFLYTAMYFPLFAALKIYKSLQLMCVTQLLINVVFNILLIPRYDLKGSSIAVVISYIYFAVVIECYYHLRIKQLLFKN